MEIQHEAAGFPMNRITAAPHRVAATTRLQALGSGLCGWLFQLEGRRKWIAFSSVYLVGVLLGVLMTALLVERDTLFLGLPVVPIGRE